jgi:hypothetical protein
MSVRHIAEDEGRAIGLVAQLAVLSEIAANGLGLNERVAHQARNRTFPTSTGGVAEALLRRCRDAARQATDTTEDPLLRVADNRATLPPL